MTKHQWFESWFDTDYYHLLYRHRDASEASSFIRMLVRHLNPSDGSLFCDLACGNGRHAQVIADMGFPVVGLDLSANNIETARLIEDRLLDFEVHDMRTPFGENRFDCVLNLFTSFGYFESDEDHLQTIRNMSQAMRKEGRVVIDFMNVHFVQDSLVKTSSEEIDGIRFYIRRLTSHSHIIKEIKVIDGSSTHFYEERVRMFGLEDFRTMLSVAGLKISETFGDYHFNPFANKTSPRLIMIAENV